MSAAVTVTATEAMLSPAGYLESSLVAACVTVALPAATPVTVISFGMFQFCGVNVTPAVGATVALSSAPLTAVTVTSRVGFVSSTTV